MENKSTGKIIKPKKKSWVKSTAGRITLSVLVLGVLASGAYEAYQHNLIPGIQQTAENLPTTFDPKATEGIISASNTVQMTPEEYAKSGPQIVENGHKIIPLAVAFKDGKIRTLRYQKSGFLTETECVLTIDGLEDGDTLLSPVDGEIEIFAGLESLEDFILHTKDSNGNEAGILYATTGLKPLINFEKPIKTGTRIPIKRGDPIGTLLTSEKHPAFDGQVQINGIIPSIIATTAEGKAIVIQ